jgi:phosphoglycerol transferase MdoB-like AlkP superfamily enzyme
VTTATTAPDVPDTEPGNPTEKVPSTGRRWLTACLTVALTLFCAWAGNFVLDYSSWRSAAHVELSRVLHPAGLLPSLLVAWIVVVLVVAVIGRLWLAMGVLAALTLVMGAANATKLEFRNDPLYPSDIDFLAQPGFLAEMVPKSHLLLGGLGLVALVLVAWLVGRLAARAFPPLSKGLSRRALVTLWVSRGVVAVLCLTLLHSTSDFNKPHSAWRSMFDATGLRWRSWDNKENYQKNGFIAGALYNMPVTAMKEPAGYSEAAMTAIAARYADQARQENRLRHGSLDHTNVITILSESFSEPTWLKTVHFAHDPIPRTTAEMAQTVSGKMLAPGYGGGTANVEFELLTGQSMSQFSPQLASPYEQLLPKYRSYPSAVSWFRAHGHDAVALHPFSPRMYRRSEVYKALGFEAFISKDQMTDRARVEHGRFISDGAAFDTALGQIQNHDKPLFLHLISMQNHMPFGGQYTDPIRPQGVAGAKRRLVGQYARGINITDSSLATFLADLKKLSEPTAVVFYGDHLPPQVYPGNLQQREGLRTIHQTPFMIWSSTGGLVHTALPTTSPSQFLPLLFKALDVPIPPMYALLEDLYQQVPAMDAGIAVDAQNKTVKPSQLDPAARQVLADYRMVQYDLSIGHRWSEGVLFGDPPT